MAALLQGDSACSHTAPWNATSMPTMEIGRIVGAARAWMGAVLSGGWSEALIFRRVDERAQQCCDVFMCGCEGGGAT